MDIRELQNGNWVLHNGERATVLGFDHNVNPPKPIQLNDSKYYGENEIGPMPLDEELLIELEFTVVPTGYSRGSLLLDVPVNGSYSILQNPITDPNLHQPIRYVHTLQNLLLAIDSQNS
ncbi:hypothetical protein [Microbacter margulisiae]|uniref:Uncharacterized protein n=1 Tax=Microbacter margulisiae TaxID=1350067 RepID=A0A7W5DSL3_9PORP|nr:hypothetical protein [Microbacter margulisiae]MBB3188317.1 hypothetical protein [Microbacter margulisiae]